MSRYELTAQAKEDVLTIWEYIARNSLQAANRVEDAVYEACSLIALNPQAGHLRTDLTELPVRFWTLPRFPNYSIVYDPASQPLTVIRILHGARDLSKLINPRLGLDSGRGMNGLAERCVYPLRELVALK
ncbi:MAG TPA: type II toxin-antitoxin system RelE/ParE family toxin [Silvibacterium sp.]|nr:type II toxin-antitoxin system RelE/ParE family toxin [Silvibacterium sp.]